MPRAEKACRIAFRNAAAKGVERGEWQESALYGKARGSAGKVAFIFSVFLDIGTAIWYATKEPRRRKAFRAERIGKWQKKRNGN